MHKRMVFTVLVLTFGMGAEHAVAQDKHTVADTPETQKVVSTFVTNNQRAIDQGTSATDRVGQLPPMAYSLDAGDQHVEITTHPGPGNGHTAHRYVVRVEEIGGDAYETTFMVLPGKPYTQQDGLLITPSECQVGAIVPASPIDGWSLTLTESDVAPDVLALRIERTRVKGDAGKTTSQGCAILRADSVEGKVVEFGVKVASGATVKTNASGLFNVTITRMN